jgi:hypothetical protein
MSNEALPHCLREVCLDGGEPAAVHRAWTKHPGRNGNDVISKDFRAGWQAGRDWQRQQAPERPGVDDELLVALEIVKANEWSAPDLDETCVPVQENTSCPACAAFRGHPHDGECWLAQAIAPLERAREAIRRAGIANDTSKPSSEMASCECIHALKDHSTKDRKPCLVCGDCPMFVWSGSYYRPVVTTTTEAPHADGQQGEGAG